MRHERIAGRVLLVLANGATLLVRGQDPANRGRGHFYWTPGGGLEPGETLAQGARREVFEEVGVDVGDLGPVVLNRVGEFPFGGRRIRQTESFFLVAALQAFDATPKDLSLLEQDAIIGFEWLTPIEMRSSEHPVYPRCLPELIESWLAEGWPLEPWFEEQLEPERSEE